MPTTKTSYQQPTNFASSMSLPERLRSVEAALGYDFADKENLVQSLKSPGVEKDDHDGNRVFARLGKPLIELYASHKKHLAGATADAMDEFSCKALAINRHEAVAKNLGLDEHIVCCPRQATPSRKTLSLAVRALIGAVWLDSGKQYEVVSQVMDRLGLSVEQQICVRPTNLDQIYGDQRLATSSIPLVGDCAMNLFFNFDLDGASLIGRNIGQCSHAPDSATALPGNSGDATFVTTPPDNTMQTLALYDSSESNARRRLEFDHWDGERHVLYNVEQVPSALLENNIKLPDSTTLDLTKLPRGESVNSLVDWSSSALGNDSTSLKRKSHTAEVHAPKRLKKAAGDEKALEHYILAEKAKYERLSLEFPTHIYVLTELTLANQIIEKDEHLSIARRLFAAVGSCESLVVLQTCLLHGRKKLPGEEADPLRPLALRQRIKVIESLGAKIAYYELLRRCHILRLYNEHAPTENLQENAFIVNTDEQCFTASGRKRGNPRNLAAANITLAMSGNSQSSAMERLASERGYSTLKRYRKLGERLRLLTDTFGYGILGLFPPSSSDLTAVTMTDEMLLRLPDKVFEHLVQLLSHDQGDVLRQFAKVAGKIVTITFSSALCDTEPFTIEGVDKEKILCLPKGSTELLTLIS